MLHNTIGRRNTSQSPRPSHSSMVGVVNLFDDDEKSACGYCQLPAADGSYMSLEQPYTSEFDIRRHNLVAYNGCSPHP